MGLATRKSAVRTHSRICESKAREEEGFTADAFLQLHSAAMRSGRPVGSQKNAYGLLRRLAGILRDGQSYREPLQARRPLRYRRAALRLPDSPTRSLQEARTSCERMRRHP